MMLALVLAIQEGPVERCPSIYRCPAVEAESKFFQKCVDENQFDTYCVEPAPGPNAKAVAKGKVRFILPSVIDTQANRRWRNATIDFCNGKLSPKAWLGAVRNLHETVHCLSFPSGPKLRDATGQTTRRAVQAEMLVTSWPGIPCFTADDIWQTRYFPGPGRLESWILAMNDYLGPMLAYRHGRKELRTARPTILRADAAPGLLVFKQGQGKETLTFFFNNGPRPIPLPPVDMGKVTINVGLDMDAPKPALNPSGFLIVDKGGE